jgi:hypothetical protein
MVLILWTSPDFGNCPVGVSRMEDGQASVEVLSPKGEQFTINFMKDYVNATNREAQATLEGDVWTVTINGAEIYEVPIAERGGLRPAHLLSRRGSYSGGGSTCSPASSPLRIST